MKLEPFVLDYETFWSTEHTLTKMSPMAYVMHPETEIISVAIRQPGKPSEVIFGENNVRDRLLAEDWSNKLLLAHNNEGFDALISSFRFGIRPKMWGCTLAMARPHHAKTAGGSLKALCLHYADELRAMGIDPVKDNTALLNTKGRHLKDFTPAEIEHMARYNGTDADQCYGLFSILAKKTSKDEMRLIDMTIRALVEPQFEIDRDLLVSTLANERGRKFGVLLDLSQKLGLDTFASEEEAVANVTKTLGSAAKFGQLLNTLGVEVPMKTSPTTGKPAPALAKTDEAFIALQDHDDPMVAMAAAARLGVKSTLLESRIEAFLAASDAVGGKLPVPLKYYGADTTGRWSGWAYNPQNLPRVSGKPSDALRNSLKAPSGMKVIVADLSGIELRVNHFLWKVPSSMALYNADPEKADLYKDFASTLYGIDFSEVSKEQRQIGKVCVAEGTLIYCKHVSKLFWCRIEDFKPEYQLWDGKEWVWAKGVVSNGWKKTQQLCGVSLTPDHLVLCGTTWREAQYVRGEKVARALETGAENFSLLGMLRASAVASPRLLLSATVGFLSTCLKRRTSELSSRLGAMLAPLSPVLAPVNCIGGTPQSYRTMNTERGYSTGFHPPSGGATTRPTNTTATMGGVGSRFANCGAIQEGSFSGMPSPLKGGTRRSLSWIASTLMGTMRQVTSGSSAAERTCSTSEKYQNSKQESLSLKRVYDILNCGPRNRFTVLSASGPLIVHNCHLGLGFGAGSITFQKVAKLMGGVDLDADESRDIVSVWRAAYTEIADGWKTCHDALKWISAGVEKAIDPWGLTWTCAEGIRTPKGLIRYPHLRKEEKDWVYGEGRNKARIYAGKVTENCLAEGTLVLTDSGWKPIEAVSREDKVHDGDNWVHHAGTVFKSVQPCVTVDGVLMTADHEVLDEQGTWKEASQIQRPFRPAIRSTDRLEPVAQQRQAMVLGGQAQGYKVFDIINAGPQHRFVVLGEGGPFIVHNCVQHLARCVIADNALAFRKATGLSPALMVHDELVYVVPEAEAEAMLATLQGFMRTPPAWWPELVTWSEGDIADTYGAAK
ncbi:MAG: DNA polymerase [Azovibrio sp.]|uniref:DNA polymerase n=1 Tax=Azovibrio sp. TaxID=1872673 RepID=UPI003C78B0E0